MNRRIVKSYSNEPEDDMFVVFPFETADVIRLHFRVDLVSRPSYATKFRALRDRYPGDTSPQRRTATIVRRVPESSVVEGRHSSFSCTYAMISGALVRR